MHYLLSISDVLASLTYLIRFHFSQMKHRVFLFHSPGYADIEVLFGPQPTPPAAGQIVVVSVMHRVCHIGSTLKGYA